MKLYLSSMMIGDHPDRLLAMAGGRGARMALITNALDNIPLEAQLEYTRTRMDAIAYFAGQGFDPSPVDLRFYFGRTRPLRDVVLRHRIVWATGGNAFLLRRAMLESGFDGLVRDLLGEGLVYGGWSAGACVAGTSLRPIGLMDDPDATAAGYGASGPVWEGLGLVPFAIISHHASDHPEAPAAGRAIEFATAQGIAHIALRDGDVLVGDGGEPELLPRLESPDIGSI
ncbi:MAG: dipeptidase [Sphingomonadales bacterium]|nr:dipeptidase [Sphingomonadales bacterium]